LRFRQATKESTECLPPVYRRVDGTAREGRWRVCVVFVEREKIRVAWRSKNSEDLCAV